MSKVAAAKRQKPGGPPSSGTGKRTKRTGKQKTGSGRSMAWDACKRTRLHRAALTPCEAKLCRQHAFSQMAKLVQPALVAIRCNCLLTPEVPVAVPNVPCQIPERKGSGGPKVSVSCRWPSKTLQLTAPYTAESGSEDHKEYFPRSKTVLVRVES